MTFYITFGQSSPFRNGWVEIEAPDEATARELAFDALGQKWAFIYTAETFKTFKPSLFPAGKLEEMIQ